MSEYLPEGKLISEQENINILHSLKMLEDAKNSEKILEAKACVCDSSHNLIVDLAGIKGIIPREEGAIGIKGGSVRDIAVISRVNRPVCFVVTDITEDENGKPIVMLSREKAQRKCLDAYISRLRCGDIVPARITHLENFGAFADIGCGIVALMPIDTISVSRIEHPAERFTVGMDIKAVIKSVENGRISLSHKELLGTWEENAERFCAGETVSGIIRSVENYGAFVELTPNLAGLAETKEGVRAGQQASVYIKSIIPEKMKIKLIIVNCCDDGCVPLEAPYFITEGHIDRWVYSTPDAPKYIVTDLSE